MSKSVQSVERAFALLELLGGALESMGLTELAAHSQLPAGTVHRLLNTMIRLGYVEQDHESRKYALGIRLLHLRGAVASRLTLGAQAMPVMKNLMRRVNETVHLAVFNQGEVVYIDRVEGLQTPDMYTRIGKRAPAHCTALGKALLAHQPDDAVTQVVSQHGLPAHTAQTITDEAALRQDLAAIRARGYALDDGESEPGVRCLAAPIRDHRGVVIAALSISGPAARIRPERDAELSGAVRGAARRISENLGYIPD